MLNSLQKRWVLFERKTGREYVHCVTDEHVGVSERRGTLDMVAKCIVRWLVVYFWYAEDKDIRGWAIFEAGI